MNIVECPRCGLRVIPKRNGECPSCKAEIGEILPEPDPPQNKVTNSSASSVTNSKTDAQAVDFSSEIFEAVPEGPAFSLGDLATQMDTPLEPRQISKRFKRKTLMSKVLPRSASIAIAKYLGYGLGGLCFVAAVALLILRPFQSRRTNRYVALCAFGFGTYLIAMARREA